jgi:hypothetical protein
MHIHMYTCIYISAYLQRRQALHSRNLRVAIVHPRGRDDLLALRLPTRSAAGKLTGVGGGGKLH